MPSSIEILKKHQLSVTDARKNILALFSASKNALAHADIEKKSSTEFDRVTIYRTLQTFVEKGIIHSIPSSDNSVRYALCKEECTAEQHQHNHIHFICDSCGITYCLDQITVPAIVLPMGFRPTQTDLIVSGTCNKCAQ